MLWLPFEEYKEEEKTLKGHSEHSEEIYQKWIFNFEQKV